MYFGRYLSSLFLLRSGEHQPGFYSHRRGLPPLYINNRTTCALHIASGFAPPWLGKDIEGAAAHHTASGFATPSCYKSPWELQKGAHRIYFCFYILTVRCSDALFVHHNNNIVFLGLFHLVHRVMLHSDSLKCYYSNYLKRTCMFYFFTIILRVLYTTTIPLKCSNVNN